MDYVSSVKDEFNRLAKEGLLIFPEDFCAGEYVRKPNCQGYFPVGDRWFLFQIDEHNTPQITGPFRQQGIVYACALMLHQAAGLEDYRFSEEERSIFIHNHYSSREELPIDRK
jgi:hypothetical protein